MWYFVTICTINRADLLGDVAGGPMRLNATGEAVARAWRWVGSHFKGVLLDEWVIMPNHLHGIVVLATPVPPLQTSGAQDVVIHL